MVLQSTFSLTTLQAVKSLEDNDWDIDVAVAHYLDGPPPAVESDDDMTEEQSHPAPSGGRRLGDASTLSHPAPSATANPASSKKSRDQPKRGGVASLRDLQDQEDSHDHDDDSDKDQEYFAGGDKSGLAVQDPGSGHNQHIQRLLDRARRSDCLKRL